MAIDSLSGSGRLDGITRSPGNDRRCRSLPGQGALAGVAGVLLMAAEADESLDIADEADDASGIGAGVATTAGAGVDVVVSVVVSFLLQPASAATLNVSAAMMVSDRMDAPVLVNGRMALVGPRE